MSQNPEKYTLYKLKKENILVEQREWKTSGEERVLNEQKNNAIF